MLSRAHFSYSAERNLTECVTKKGISTVTRALSSRKPQHVAYQMKSLKIKPFGACQVSPLFLRYSGFRKRRWILLSSTASRY
jgi:hypothetical protein